MTRFKGAKEPEGVPLFFTTRLIDDHFLTPDAVAIPVLLKAGRSARARHGGSGEAALPGMTEDAVRVNLCPTARAYLASLSLPDPDTDQVTAELIWYHALAIGYSPAYLKENADGIRQDWPRIPLPNQKDLLLAAATLGRQVAALLDTETPVPGVTAGKIREDLKDLAVFVRVDGKPAKPETGDLDLTAGWGHAGKGGVTMPGKGRMVNREDGAYDIYLNDIACWRGVPKAVWEYTIGGYQVIKKWLSYREKDLLGRGLTPEEVRYVTEMARRLAALVSLHPELDANYRAVAEQTFDWRSS
jgi:hypothetical protein